MAGVHVRLPETVETGIRSSNSEPCRGPAISDRTHTRSPPIFRARPLATRRPRPSPSFCRVRESSSRENGLKRFGMKAGGMPGPVSTTLMTRKCEFWLKVALRVTLPRSVNLMAFKNTHETSFARSRSSAILSSLSADFLHDGLRKQTYRRRCPEL